jgi:SecD/SecF fusion protein
MKNYGLPLLGVTALAVASLLIIGSYGPTLGIDLSGGTILVYQVKPGTRSDKQTMDDLISSLKQRLNPDGVMDMPIRMVGSNRVEVILAEATSEKVDELKRKITEVGALEFRILANHKHDSAAIARIDRASSRDQVFKQPPSGYRWARLGESLRGGKDEAGKAIPGAPAPEIVSDTEIRLPGREITTNRFKESQVLLRGRTATGTEDTTQVLEIASNTGDTIRLTRPHGFRTLSSYVIEYNPSKIVESGRNAPEDPIVRDWDRGKGSVERYVLLKVDREDVRGELLTDTFSTQDERLQPAVGFRFGAKGANRFGRLTGSHLPEEGGRFRYRLAVLLDDLVRSAPAINSEIRDSGIIEGVRGDEVKYLISILKSGSLPASIDPTPLLELKVGPTLGRDTIDKGVRAITISLFVVPIFMIAYYRFAGVVAVLALLLNMILLVASMVITSSSFTLPGLAGLALTIGMAVDANVLIFERMREEKERGASLIQQIRNGYDRAWSTIFDSNLTTVLSGIVLYAIGTEEVKGFALTLIIGLVWNLFTAVYFTRMVFEFLYQKGWVKSISMMPRPLGKTMIDFIRPRHAVMAASAVAITIGLILFGMVGSRAYNIDFTGGTLVALQLSPNAELNGKPISGMTTGQRAAAVRDAASGVLKDATVETLSIAGESDVTRFNVRTTDTNVRDVQASILKALGSALDKVAIRVSDPTPIPVAATPVTPPATADGKAAEPALGAVAERFAGGSKFDLTFSRPIVPNILSDRLRETITADGQAGAANHFEVVPSGPVGARGTATGVTLRTDLDPAKMQGYLSSVTGQLADDPSLLFDRLENFGGAVASEARTKAIMAIVASWVIIILYLWFRFKSVTYGVAAVIALVHDVLIALGAVALTHYVFPSPYKIDLPMVAAFLTLIGFSVNDTIVIFDRIRELKGRSPVLTADMVNLAINQTLSRTFLTSLTALSVVVIFYFFGGEGLTGFSFCLMIGFLSGVYSTIYIAAPILVDWIGTTDKTTAASTSSDTRPIGAGRSA